MSHRGTNYEQRLHKAGFRLTEQRIAILDAVCAGGGHSTLKQVYARAQDARPDLDRSSVYRVLRVFEDVGLIVSGINHVGDVVYEIAHEQPHHHLICSGCGDEYAVDHDLLVPLFERLQTQSGYTITSRHLVITGRCPQCQNSEECPEDT